MCDMLYAYFLLFVPGGFYDRPSHPNPYLLCKMGHIQYKMLCRIQSLHLTALPALYLRN